MPESEHRIVVGVDGSEHSKAALRWAIRQAAVTGASLDAVMAWRYPAAYGISVVAGDLDLEGEAKKALAETLSQAGDEVSGVTVRQLVGEGPPAEVLLSVAKGADLLVVGSRGHGGFASAVLGSVSLACVLHSACPVLVYRDSPAGS